MLKLCPVIKTLALSASLALASAVTGAQAAIIYPTVVGVSSQYPGYPATDAVDGNPNTDWANNSVGAGSWIELDLGGAYSLATAYVTDRVTSGGTNGSFTGGLFDFTTQYTLQAYSNNSFSSPLATFVVSPTYPPAGTVNEPSAPLPGLYCLSLSCFQTTVGLGGIVAEYWKYTIVSQNDSQGTYNNAGLDDIHFSTTPLPAALPLFAGGLGLIGFFGARRRRRLQAA
jgi:hypothetical protein